MLKIWRKANRKLPEESFRRSILGSNIHSHSYFWHNIFLVCWYSSSVLVGKKSVGTVCAQRFLWKYSTFNVHSLIEITSQQERKNRIKSNSHHIDTIILITCQVFWNNFEGRTICVFGHAMAYKGTQRRFQHTTIEMRRKNLSKKMNNRMRSGIIINFVHVVPLFDGIVLLVHCIRLLWLPIYGVRSIYELFAAQHLSSIASIQCVSNDRAIFSCWLYFDAPVKMIVRLFQVDGWPLSYGTLVRWMIETSSIRWLHISTLILLECHICAKWQISSETL